MPDRFRPAPDAQDREEAGKPVKSLFLDRRSVGERALLLHPILEQTPTPDAAETISLAESAGMTLAGRFTAKRRTAHARWLLGPGKLDEVRAQLLETGADLLLINGDLTASQERNLEQALRCRVMSREELILLIFARRARSSEGQLQVALAQLNHARTRLVRGWSHLDRQRGGIGLRGAGEKQVELDQRLLEARLKTTRARLAQVTRSRQLGRRRRHRSGARAIALVGYANAGKSSLFNALTDARVAAEDRPFATLDPTLRKLAIDGAGDLVLADTVGFVSHLPHCLIEAFKATLEEVSQADLLIHVLDGTTPLEERAEAVEQVLQQIDAAHLPRMEVVNKCDLAEVADVGPNRLGISAVTGQGLDVLRRRIGEALGVQPATEVHLPISAGRLRAWLYQVGAVLAETPATDGGSLLRIKGDRRTLARLRRELQPLV